MKKYLLPLAAALAVFVAGCSNGDGGGKDGAAEATLTVALLVVLVQILQSLGDRLVTRYSRR